ncbi:FimV family protein [Thiocystis violacea]|uniref:FimV family protein n=1 Tax=Thiocystis violacea TaxID=13725 RepID=UPI001907F6EA|nr:FimV family protein [Thiocystis violacea]MBK1723766.1 hypothetical protein [Thiocystis violacea]
MSRKLILASAVTMVLAGTDVSALGLGGLRTQSALNQPYLGEIELREVRSDEIDSVSASIASQDAFTKAGVERYYYLTKLKFTPEVTPQGRAVLRVSSKDPIREPYMDFLVEVVWPTGKLLKEYTILLDPPALSTQGAPDVRAARAASATGTSRPTSSLVSASGRASSYIPAPGDGFPVYAGPVGNGKGLWALAREVAPAGSTVAQTAMALYRNNQNAFIRGNINRLIAGKTLVIPSRAELFALDAGAAEREYVASLRGRAQYRAPITPVTPEMLDSRLRLSGGAEPSRGATQAEPPAAATTSPKVQQDVMLALETSESTRQETVELRDRIRELETQLADIQTLLQLRNDELARMQSVEEAIGAAAEAPTDAIAAALESPVTAPEDAQGASGTELALVPGEVVPPEADSGQTPLSGTDTDTGTTATADAMESLDTALAEEDVGLVPVPLPTPAPAVVEEVTEVVATPVAPLTSAAETAASEETSSTWHSLLLPLAGLAGVTAVGIGIFSWLAMRRRREEEEFEQYELDSEEDRYDTLDVSTEPRSSVVTDDRETIAARSPLGDESMSESLSAGTRDGEAEGDSGVSMMSSLSNFDAETDEADILSEADIYIAYGRYSEAQDLLQGELQRFPERLDVKFKLAEAFAGAKDLDSLTAVMDEIREAGGQTQDPGQWEKLAAVRARLQSGDPMDQAAPPVMDQAARPVDEDSFELGLGDSFSLDISDVQKMSEPGQGANFLGDLDLDDTALTKKEPSNGPDSLLAMALDESELNGDSFGDAMTVAVNRDTEGRAGADDSDIELSLDDHRVEDLDDLDSIFDSNVVNEPTLARDEIEGGRPTEADVSARRSSVSQDSSEHGLPPDQESVPSDLLSSQWQIDSGIWDETATKLDLARAYIEMDDKDAAREILEEVVSEGRDEQKSEAQALLETLV